MSLIAAARDGQRRWWTKGRTRINDYRMATTKTVNIHEAKTHFSKLLKRVERGEEVIIARSGTPVAKISALEKPKPRDRVPGTGKGFFTAEEIDVLLAPLPHDIRRYFDGESDDDE